MSNTSWVTASWRSRPTMFAALVTLFTALATVAAHLLAGGGTPGVTSLLLMALGLGVCFEGLRRFPGSLVRLLGASLGVQLAGHLVLATTTSSRPVGTAPRARGVLASGGAHCGLHDLSALTLPGADGSSSGLMTASHLVGALLAVLLAVAVQRLGAVLRAWLHSLSGRLRGSLGPTIRHRAAARWVAPIPAQQHLIGLTWRGPPTAA